MSSTPAKFFILLIQTKLLEGRSAEKNNEDPGFVEKVNVIKLINALQYVCCGWGIRYFYKITKDIESSIRVWYLHCIPNC
jgi:hypothetical protein